MKPLIAKLLLVLLTVALSANAQDAPACTATDLDAALPSLQQALADIQAQVTQGDLESALAAIRDAKTQLGELEAQCTGLHFSGTETNSSVVGPVSIPAGVYRVRGDFTSFGSASLERLTGDCGFGGSVTSNHLVGSSQAGGEIVETIFRSQGCDGFLEIWSEGNWKLDFEYVGVG